MVKYSTMSSAAVRIDLARSTAGVEVTLTDYDVEPFDVTRAPDVDIELPIEQRRPGGLGLHLIRRLVDSIEYEYSRESRQSRTTFRKTRAGRPARGRGEHRGRACSRLNSARMTSSSLRDGWTPPRPRPPRRSWTRSQGKVTLDCSGARVHLQRRPGRAAEDPEAAAGGGRQAPAVRGQPPPAGHLRSIRASTRSSRSNPPADPAPTFPPPRV